jgi:acyl carrier protein
VRAPSARVRRCNVTSRFSTLREAATNPSAVNAMTTSRVEKIRQLIRETLPPSGPGETSEIIFGPGGRLDSLGLVNFVADLEFRVAQEFGAEIALASEQAMSRSRSPFRDVTALADYIAELLPS